jgi:hypothetical protein
MTKSRVRELVLGLALGLSLSAGCAAIQAGKGQSTEELLSAAGFTPMPASTPEKLAHLKTMPPLKLVSRSKDGKLFYSYADPDGCKCLYVGGSKEYAEYRQLAAQRQAGQAEEPPHAGETSTDWLMWSGLPLR